MEATLPRRRNSPPESCGSLRDRKCNFTSGRTNEDFSSNASHQGIPMIPGSDVISSLKNRAERHPNDQALIFSTGSLSFAEVDRLSSEYANGFKAIGISRGCRTVMMVHPG